MKSETEKKSALSSFILISIVIAVFIWLYRSNPNNRSFFNFIFKSMLVVVLILIIEYLINVGL